MAPIPLTAKAEPDAEYSREYLTNLYRLRTAHFIRNIPNLNGIWYDAGAGISYTRELLGEHFGNKVLTTNVDLNLEQLPFHDGQLDVTTHLDVIEHLLNPLFAMMEVHRALGSGGVLYLATPNDRSLIYKLEHLLNRKYAPHFHQFTEGDLRWLLEVAGFKIKLLTTFKRSWRGKIARFCKNSFWVVASK